jgi:hypothetical protein
MAEIEALLDVRPVPFYCSQRAAKRKSLGQSLSIVLNARPKENPEKYSPGAGCIKLLITFLITIL